MVSTNFCLARACVSKYIHITFNPVCVWMCECVSAHANRSGEQMEARSQQCWCRSWESSHGDVSLGERASAKWGPGWRTDVMEPILSWTSLSPTVCRSDSPSVALTVEPPAYLSACSASTSHFLWCPWISKLSFHCLNPDCFRAF